MVGKTAWFLNFDAEEELSRPAGYTPSRAVLQRSEALTERVRALLLPGDVIVAEGQTRPLEAGFIGAAWCPTPRARRALERAGALAAAAPALEVLRAVNHRRFNAMLGQTLPGARYALTLAEVEDAFTTPSPTGQWLLKRPFGFAGRGRVKVNPSLARDLEHARSWLLASLRSGEGLAVEPFVERLGDFALHGHLSPAGDVVLGRPTRQECDSTGAWNGTALASEDDLTPDERRALIGEAAKVAAALHGAGYFGPFNIDAYRYRGAGGGRLWNPRSEVNARYSMGWATGMAELRPDVAGRTCFDGDQ
jgi:hypothetical protein